MPKGMLVIISGPSGCGKDSVISKLDKNLFSISISMTTRKQRPYEVEGVDYFFCTEEEFVKKREKNEFLEHAVYLNNYYGTPKQYVLDQIDKGKIVILEIDVVGALQVKDAFSDTVLIFLMAQTFEILEQRLINRKTEDITTIERRLLRAKEEVNLINKYDYLVINDEIELAVNSINNIVKAEQLKPKRNEDLIISIQKSKSK